MNLKSFDFVWLVGFRSCLQGKTVLTLKSEVNYVWLAGFKGNSGSLLATGALFSRFFPTEEEYIERGFFPLNCTKFQFFNLQTFCSYSYIGLDLFIPP